MNIQTISTKQLRENFGLVKKAMGKGQSLLLIYRSVPLAEIKPVKQAIGTRNFSKSQLSKWISDDRLSDAEQKKIDKIIENLP